MIRLSAIEVRGFRAFAGWERLDLRPLTLVYGRNNAGKSSLLRLLVLLSDSVAETAVSPLDMTGPAGRRGHFRDLPWTGDNVPRHAFRVRLHWQTSGVGVGDDEFELTWSTERRCVLVREIHLRAADGSTSFRARALPFPDDQSFDIADRGVQRILWDGLLPVSEERRELVDLRTRLTGLRRDVVWLDSNRPRSPRLTGTPPGPLRQLRSDGSNAIDLLASDPALLAAVQPWYAATPVLRELRFQEVSADFLRLMLARRGHDASFQLLDSGEGMAHVLPLLVGGALVSRPGGPRTLIAEEPEAHLHDDAQHHLAQHFTALVAGDDPPTIVLETHSRALLLGVQLAVANGARADRVGVAWCGQDQFGASTVHPVVVTAKGGLSGWPRDALAEELEMSRRLLAKQTQGA